MDVFRQRLEDEYDANVIITSPSVPYEVVYRGGKTKLISNPVEFPDNSDFTVIETREPMVRATIIVPDGVIFYSRFFNTLLKYSVILCF